MKQQTTIIEEIIDTRDCITTSKCSSTGATSKSHSGFSDYTSSCSALSTHHSTVKFEDNKPQNQITKNILEINKQRMKLPSSKYRGAVPQANGRWGAQLYNGHRRIWLGTFDCQDQAARAHDLAALRFRGAHAAVNFPGRHYSRRPHLEFLAAHSMAEVVAMLRCHTYDDELARFMRSRLAAANNRTKKPPSPSHDPGVTRRRLFQKVLTASDVGNGTLHRLVIPRCHAERDLPALSGGGSSEKKGMTLTFEEIGGGERMWRFKFCYWKGSKNYVFTKGWSHFVRVKDLKPGDVVTFYTSSVNDVGDENHQKQRLYIESSSNSGSNMSSASPNCLFRSETTAAKFSASSTVSSNISSDDQHSDYEEDNSRLRILRLFGFDIDLHLSRLAGKNQGA